MVAEFVRSEGTAWKKCPVSLLSHKALGRTNHCNLRRELGSLPPYDVSRQRVTSARGTYMLSVLAKTVFSALAVIDFLMRFAGK